MAGGRPAKGTQQRYPELEELASWLRQALPTPATAASTSFRSRAVREEHGLRGLRYHTAAHAGIHPVPRRTPTVIDSSSLRAPHEIRTGLSEKLNLYRLWESLRAATRSTSGGVELVGARQRPP